MLNTGMQQEVKIDQLFSGFTSETKVYNENLQRLANLISRLEEQPPSPNKQPTAPKPEAFGPGHLYRLHSLLEETASNNMFFNELLNRLSQYI